MPTTIPIKELTRLAKAAALEAGQAIMEVYQSEDFGVERKGDASPLTKADKAAHLAILKYLEPSGLPVLSEEGKDIPYEKRKDWDYFWMVDPLDGTKEFIKKNGEFTVNIALIHKRQPIMGVVYAPVLDWLYWGNREDGAWKQETGGQPLSLEKQDGREVSTIVASRSHLSAETQAFIGQYPGVQIVSMGSSLKFMLVAEGKAQLYPRFAPTMEWDTAAAQAVLEAAGGQVLKYPEDEPMDYNREDMLNGWFVAKGG
ncbi:3'(2'),5'-bisphosphate nucleotidase CysQ [Negadavirga shengliensis]|uniref:3'(2'),5'-bisphosphate nucleotidase CysQ n=1 Tax=Negadavirga shengliensis TaxID=1389218 RepID=A0ABV9SYQ5_9BACT